jgi:hypothetical protein
MEAAELRKNADTRWRQLEKERTSWLAQWQDISSLVLPRNGRFLVSDRNKGERKHNKIYDSTGTRALRTMAAGMMAGLSSPARPWFRLTTADPSLDEADSVKTWLAQVTRLLLMVFARGNTNRTLHGMYEELGAFGTAATVVLDDFDTVIHHHALTAGEYAIATDARGIVDTLGREYEITVGQMVRAFGRENCSIAVQNLADRGSFDAWVPVVHMIEPRELRDTKKRDAKNMAFGSVYFEPGGASGSVLRESGFKSFPGICPRWAVSGGDIYGNSPAMEALGDIGQLQHEQLRKAQGLDYMTMPPLQAPVSMAGQGINMIPGGVTYVDAVSPQAAIRSAFDVNLNLSHLLEDIRDVRQRIDACFYVDLFRMLSIGPTNQMTATEVAERHEEKLLMLGPVTERMQNEVHSPLVDRAFEAIVAANLVPPPPPELQGRELGVEYISLLAQAQREVSGSGMDRFITRLGEVAMIKPDVLDKFDADQWADVYSDLLGAPPELIVPGERVALVRQARAEAQAEEVRQAQAAQQAQTMQTLSKADVSGQNVLAGLARTAQE